MAVNKTPIPKTIRVGNKKYSIEIVETMLQRRRMGMIDYSTQRITLGRKSNVTGQHYSQAVMTETFWHELVHAILNDMGQTALNKDEKFVSEFSKQLTKAIKSARF